MFVVAFFMLGCSEKSQEDSATAEDTGPAVESDIDGDGFTASEDCDDYNPNINPQAEEIPNDDIDQDCDGEDLKEPALSVASTTISFATPVGCQEEWEVTLQNLGEADLDITQIEVVPSSSDFMVTQGSGLSLGPGASAAITIGHMPTTGLISEHTLEISSNDPFNPQLSIPIVCQPTSFGQRSQTQIQSDPAQPRPIDILFAVDTSPSMMEHVYNLEQALSEFITPLHSNNLDYHVTMVTQDSGCIQGPVSYVDSSFSVSDAQSALADMVQVGASYNSNNERAFSLWEAALEETQNVGCNAGFLRSNAVLALVGISDEAEDSPQGFETYVAEYQTYKTQSTDVVVHGIGDDSSDQCTNSEEYSGVYEATQLTGGSFHYICEDMGAVLGSLAESLHEQAIYTFADVTLEEWPVAESITVEVDGVAFLNAWIYDAAHNKVIFNGGYVPEAGAVVTISYEIMGVCN